MQTNTVKMFRTFNRNSFRNIYSIITRLSSGKVKESRKIRKYFAENGQASNLGLFPNDFKRLNARKSLGIYVADAKTANEIASKISRFQRKNVPFFEINPGPCILTKALISQLELKILGLTEKNELFADIQLECSNKSNVKILRKILKPYKCYHQIAEFILEHCESRRWHEDVSYQLFICAQFREISCMIMDVLKQRQLFANGRAEIFAVISTNDYVVEYDADFYYFVRIVPKRDLFSQCQPDDLRLLGFFVYQCFFKRSGYIIPKLEQWIPGIGVDLITANSKQKSSANEEAAFNQSESNPFTQFNDIINVFTECGSLTPSEIFALFLFLRKSPHYKTSCFHQQCNAFYATKTNKSHDAQGQTASEEEESESIFDKSYNIEN